MLEVLKAGLLTTIQDKGRQGFRQYGVPVSGALDSYSAAAANALVGNSSADALIEMTLVGASFKFYESTSIGISGGDFSPQLNGKKIKNNEKIGISSGDVLEFSHAKDLVRCYLSVAGGFKTEKVLGSRSFSKVLEMPLKIENRDQIPYIGSMPTDEKVSVQSRKIKTSLDCLPGPEWNLLTDFQRNFLSSSKFTIGLNDRMAYHLEERLENVLPSILSSAVFPGVVQLTPSGKLIVLTRDCQTTGGYPRVLVLSEKSLDHLAQLKQQQQIKFNVDS